jgi:hypothetical protein
MFLGILERRQERKFFAEQNLGNQKFIWMLQISWGVWKKCFPFSFANCVLFSSIIKYFAKNYKVILHLYKFLFSISVTLFFLSIVFF